MTTTKFPTTLPEAPAYLAEAYTRMRVFDSEVRNVGTRILESLNAMLERTLL